MPWMKKWMNLVTTSLVFARLIELLCTGVEQESVVVTAFVLLVAASSGEAAPSSISFPDLDRGGVTLYIQMIGMIVIFFRGCNRRVSIF